MAAVPGTRRAVAITLAVVACWVASPAAANQRSLKQTNPLGLRTSSLWGTNGELYKPSGSMLDYSYAGYAAGEAPIPATVNITHNIKDFGAVGDGVKDDTAAFERAFAEIPAGTLFIPPGKYVILRQLVIEKSIGLRGAGSPNTLLLFPRSMGEVYGMDNEQARRAGFIRFRGRSLTGGRITDITAVAKKGDNVIKVGSTANLKAGEWVRVAQGPPADGNWTPMNQGVSGGCSDFAFCQAGGDYGLTTRIAQIVDGNTVLLERPLPWDIFPSHQPKYVGRFAPTISNIGIEGFSIIFLAKPYPGHLKEYGYNGLQLTAVANSWIRDVQVMDADDAISVGSCVFVTVMGVRLLGTKQKLDPEKGVTGHHGIVVGGGSDNLITYFEVLTRFHHDVSVDRLASGNVFSIGRGIDLNMDHHRAQNYGNLWTQLDFGRNSRAFDSSGSGNRGMHAGSFTTYWNLGRTATNLLELTNDFGPALNFAGLPAGMQFPSAVGAARTWKVDGVPQDQLYPPNIYYAQWALRMSSPNKVSPQLGGKGNGGVPPNAV